MADLNENTNEEEENEERPKKEQTKKGKASAKKGPEEEQKERIPIILLIISIVNLVVFVISSSVIIYYKIFFTRPIVTEEKMLGKVEEDQSKGKVDFFLYDLGVFTVNLLGSDGYKVLSTKISLEFFTPDTKKEVENKITFIRDIIIKSFSSKYFYELQSVQAKLLLKDQIIKQINEILDFGSVRSIYFSEFLIQ